ncbi:protocadherin-11 X-linked-like [Saccostrea echinata]|uniref:protocadherin-11 X-linked-like n=1 Tax=Saccostrea echinata TaxID=191078 RepID=UPI002A810625|nr:protocadherin-11 X-linked-like [Saccostrea echinata]
MAAVVSMYLFLMAVFTVSCEIIVNLNIREEKPVSTLVGNIASLSNLTRKMTPEAFQSLRYSFLDQTKGDDLFRVDNEAGDLFTNAVIDRENECGFNQECVFQFDIAAHSSIHSRFEIISVRVTLLDINDHTPIFPSSVVNKSLSESAVIGSTIQVDEASDLDSSALNGIKSYSMLTTDSPFLFNASKVSDGFTLQLKLNSAINREKKDNYELKIIAVDGGSTPRTGTLTIKIEVTDENDNAPQFERQVFDVSLREDRDVGFQVIQLSATDADIGQNGQITYKFNPRQSFIAEISQYFAINETTGKINLKNKLSQNTRKNYNITVDASDLGQPPKVSQCVVRVSIIDVGNNRPLVRITLLSTGNTGAVSESSSVGTVIAHVTVEDTDSGSNGIVTCKILSEEFQLQTVLNKGYIVVINKSLDREISDKYNLTVECIDQGNPPLSTSSTLVVPISDENDNAPEFYKNIYQASIRENNAFGDGITQVLARDQDVGKNAEIKYILSPESKEKLAINEETGVITANFRFDRENMSSYFFHILAVDKGSPSMTGTATIHLTVVDANDNKPTFSVPVFQFFVMENMGPQLKVGSLSATDLDEGDNQKILFDFHPNFKNLPSSQLPFEVLPSGIISTKRDLDREDRSKYSFDLVAVDQGTPRLTSTSRVIVYVADQNDNKPFITFPLFSNQTVTVSYQANVGTVITQIRAYDLDETGPNSQLRYSISAGNEKDIFSIGETSGTIYLKRTYEITENTPFKLRINVSDMNVSHMKSSFRDMTIVLTLPTASSQALEDGGTKNIIITIAVVALTIILSAVIITVIIILRRNDQKLLKSKRSDDIVKTMYDPATPGDCSSPNLEKNPSDMVSSIVDTPRKKKEVSFTFEMENMQLFQGSQRSQEQRDEISNSRQNNMKALNSSLLNNLGGSHNQHHPDNMSDSSGEITASDSGRGGSDLDLSLHLPKSDERQNRGDFKLRMNPNQGTRPYGNQYENINYVNTHHTKNNNQREAIPARPPRCRSDNKVYLSEEDTSSKTDCFPSYV